MVKTNKRAENLEIINKFLNIEKSKGDKRFWPREFALSKKLLQKFSIEFFRFCESPNFKLPSLAWFLTNAGKDFINEQYFEFQRANLCQNNKEEAVLSTEKVGKDIEIVKKPKTLKDFLNLYGKN